MKTSRLLLILAGFLLLNSCEKDNDSEFADYLVATPLTMSAEQFEAAVDIFPPQPLTVSGKIYAFGNRIFVNEPFKGVHLIDNRDPSAPRKTGFINIPGNVDIAVRDNYLFADSLSDLVVLDISNPDNIRPVARLKGVLQDHVPWPFEADIVEYDGWNAQDEILVGWEMRTERLSVSEVEGRNRGQVDFLEAAADNASGTGQGGSLARFKIVEDFLYAVDSHTINVFDISNLEAPVAGDDVFAGFDIETIFNRGGPPLSGQYAGDVHFRYFQPCSSGLRLRIPARHGLRPGGGGRGLRLCNPAGREWLRCHGKRFVYCGHQRYPHPRAPHQLSDGRAVRPGYPGRAAFYL